MSSRRSIFALLAVLAAFPLHAQEKVTIVYGPADTSGIYSDRKDSLSATVFSASRKANFISSNGAEVISAAGLCKMACCALAESFENSASVSVGYSDAVTGARQIRLLGQNGIYTQMLDENRPVMRGLSAPFGLNYVPGQWLESIQIAKGVTSVINGVESMTGQINLEHRKPTDERPLYVQASLMDDSKADLNVVSSLQLDDAGKWSTVILAHVDGNFKSMDMNSDGFMDDPRQFQLNFSNRWLYYDPSGFQLRFGVRALQDSRLGGQMESFGEDRWKADIRNRSLNGYLKAGVPVGDGESSVALVLDATTQRLDSGIGLRDYDAVQNSFFANLLWQNEINEDNRFTVGISEMLDCCRDIFCDSPEVSGTLSQTGIFGEYTFHRSDVFSSILGLREDYFAGEGFRFSPRLTMKYAPSKDWVFRFNGGRGLRYSMPLVDNFGVLSTGKAIFGDFLSHPLEDAWTVGVSAGWTLPFDRNGKTSLNVDWFMTGFSSQMLVDHQTVTVLQGGKPVSQDAIFFYELGSLVGHNYSHTNNVQMDFTTEPFRGFTATLTGRLTDARQTLKGQSDDIKPMTSLYKAVLNLQYATRLNKWIFDFTASLNGPCRVWDFMRGSYPDGYTDTYPLVYAQVTKRFKGIDIYAGGENLTGYTQKDPIIGALTPFSPDFDASCVWGPLMGARFYAGVRVTIWKTV